MPKTTKTPKPQRDARDDLPAAGLTVGQLRDLVRDVVRAELEAAEGREQPALIDAATLAKTLGVTTRTIHNLRQRGMPTEMVMQSPRFVLADVLAWLKDPAQVIDWESLGVDKSAVLDSDIFKHVHGSKYTRRDVEDFVRWLVDSAGFNRDDDDTAPSDSATPQGAWGAQAKAKLGKPGT